MIDLTTYLYTQDINDIKPDINEIYRYMGIKGIVPENIMRLTKECLEKAYQELKLTACYMFLPVNIKGNEINFDLFSVNSEALIKELSGLKRSVVFAATAGTGIDRLIARYSAVSPSYALVYQAIGTEMIEKFCDNLCIMISKKYSCNLTRRFSPGYADFDLKHQRDIANILTVEKRCGITLTDSMIMRPSKSVTAIAGIGKSICADISKCDMCSKINCLYRKI